MEKRNWYSHELDYKKASKLEKKYAKITSPSYGLNDRDDLGLHFQLNWEDGAGCDLSVVSSNDIKQLLIRTKTREVQELEGKIVEAWEDKGLIRGISVNERLV